MYHTEPPTNKTISQRYKKFQHSGCLCTVKRTGRLGVSAETVEGVREMLVRSPPRVEISSTCKVGQKHGVSLPVDTLHFGITILPTIPQRSEIPKGLTNYPVHIRTHTYMLQCVGLYAAHDISSFFILKYKQDLKYLVTHINKHPIPQSLPFV
jgi:hypothetical protein